MSGPYAAALDYWRADHRGALYLPLAKKGPPPVGYTGWGGRWPTMADVVGWVEDYPNGNIALRLDEKTLGFDVDAYEGKKGGETLAALEAELGPRPATISSTSRGFGVSRIQFFRVPSGLAWRDDLVDIELIHYGHRYAVVWPSVHDKTGEPYLWYDQEGQVLEGIPDFSDLPELPDSWVEYLGQGEGGGAHKADADRDELLAWYHALSPGNTCEPVDDRWKAALKDLASRNGSRHNAARGAVASLIGYGANGHRGVPAALDTVRDLFYTASGKPGDGHRTPRQAESEWKRLLTGAIRMQIAEHPQPDQACNCVVGKVVIGDTTPADRQVDPVSLEQCVATFREWMHLPDPGPVYVSLATVLANRGDGDPIWTLLVGGPSSGKTEPVLTLRDEPDCHLSGPITEAALLSGTPKRDSKGAKGGLLREIGDFGILLVKDFTSVLSMYRDTRAALLAALREIYDGTWTRHVGTDGGRTLHWDGKIGLLGCVTSTIDSAHSVMASMGERFVLYRMPESEEAEQSRTALGRSNGRRMRLELAAAMRGVLAEASDRPVRTLTSSETETLVALSQLVARGRSTVDRDGYSREINLVYEPEGPARIALVLKEMLLALDRLGLPPDQVHKLILKLGLDSIPNLRRRALDHLLNVGDRCTTTEISIAVDHPTKTTHRTLEDLAAHRLVVRTSQGPGKPDLWEASEWTLDLWRQISETETQGTYGKDAETQGDSLSSNSPLPLLVDISVSLPDEGEAAS